MIVCFFIKLIENFLFFFTIILGISLSFEPIEP